MATEFWFPSKYVVYMDPDKTEYGREGEKDGSSTSDLFNIYAI